MTWKLVQGSVDPVYIIDPITGRPGSESGAEGLHIKDSWVIDTLSDVALNDSDKSFVVPSGYYYYIMWIYVVLATSAVVGSRQLVAGIYDSLGRLIAEFVVGVTQAASTTYRYMLAPALADLTAVRDSTWLMTPIPPTLMLKPGQSLRVWDNTATDAAADDMTVYIQIGKETV